MLFSIEESDTNFYSLNVEAGDIVGATVSGSAGRIVLIDPEGVEVIGSSQDATFIAPEQTELPGGGNAVLAHVADTPGRYAVGIETGFGEYDALFRLRRPPLESEPDAATQTLFLDFDGEELNTGIFGGPGVRTLSPLSAFLPGWSLGPEDEDAVIDAIVASVAESLSEDLRVKGRNSDRDATGRPGDFDVEILNSRDHPDPFGQDNVSRAIVGGTIGESGIPTIGIAQTIDVGNFDQTESALTLLDLLSAPADDPNSLN